MVKIKKLNLFRYGEKILKLSKHIDKVMNIFVQKPDESEFNVINHGDCWVNNMLFKYDSHNKPIKHIFVSENCLRECIDKGVGI